MGKPLIRVLAFFLKEINEVRRQPKLILSLILGPFLILLLFGAGYRSNRPTLQMALVVPQELQEQIPMDRLIQVIQANFELVDVHTSEEPAMQQLQAGRVDVVEILPADILARVLRGDRSFVEFRYNEINPFNEQWVQYLAYVQVSEMNRQLLLQATRRVQNEADTMEQLLIDARSRIVQAQEDMSPEERAEAQVVLRQIRNSLDNLAGLGNLIPLDDSEGANVAQTRQQLTTLSNDLLLIEQALARGDIEDQQERIDQTLERFIDLEEAVEQLHAFPSDVIISPLYETHENLQGNSLDFMIFYAPGVFMLVIHHIAVTLAALALVRERMLGALELYQVAPVSMMQVLLGKYAGYTCFITVIAVTLLGLMYWGLGVPFLGSMQEFIGLFFLFTMAALGIGFLISLISSTDSQAVQLSMLVLLLSIFFGGFLLPLDHFWQPVRLVSYMLPLTHGIIGSHDILLKGVSVPEFHWLCLAGIAVGTFGLLVMMTRHQFRHL